MAMDRRGEDGKGEVRKLDSTHGSTGRRYPKNLRGKLFYIKSGDV
jgi:hypothetical protein